MKLLLLVFTALLLLSGCSSKKVSKPAYKAKKTTKNSYKKNKQSGSWINVALSKEYSKWDGTPYKYGGTTTLGMDCSGLLMRSFESIDMYIPRTSKEQSKLGRKVTMGELKKGDLVFFKTVKKKGRVTHAGLVTDARKKDQIIFIHASSSKGVIEANLMSDYYRKAFTKARRLKF